MKILVAMSGGVDSSVSAFLLKKEGFEVVGATFKLFDSAGAERAISDAKKVSDFLGIDHEVIDLSEDFKTYVIDYFIGEYSSGRTPNPCVVCNKKIKFGLAIEKMSEYGCEKIATGHYTCVELKNGRYVVRRCPHLKDQSYCFCMLSQSQLSKIITPISGLTKEQVRNIAHDNNIPVWNKNESQDICFIDTSYRDFLVKNGIQNIPGNFIDENGNILGKHGGICNYTVGQRRGLNCSSNKRLYVQEINKESNDIILSERLSIKKIILKNINFVSFDRGNYPKDVKVCVRYNSMPIDSTIEFDKKEDDRLNVNLKQSTPISCPGQFAVCYRDDFLVCGGVINNICNS